jgi:putative FmdB family regulatory protein
MPTYSYQCDACDHQFDEFQMMSEDPLKKCPECGKKKLRRAFGTGAAILFKGTGFYETDYRSDSYKQAAKADGEAAKSTTDAAPKTDTASKPSSPAEGSSGKTATKSSKSNV